VVYYRVGSSGAFSHLTAARAGKVMLPRPFAASLQAGTRIEYYAEVLDQGGGILVHVGTNALPFAVSVGRPPVQVAKKWWFWTAVVGVAAAAAVGGGLGYYYTRPEPPITVPISPGLGIKY
jgi:hypothetical protein